MFTAARAAAVVLALPLLQAQGPAGFDPGLFREMQWRNIGPHRASRTKALDGVAGQPHTSYMGVVNGGVWKTTDAGRSWTPMFDDQPTGSIGALAVAPSNPSVIYVGTGEAQQRPDLAAGDGMYIDPRVQATIAEWKKMKAGLRTPAFDEGMRYFPSRSAAMKQNSVSGG